MTDQDLIAQINEAKEMAEDLQRRLHRYKEISRDPDATESIPDLNYMCELADQICKKLAAPV